MALIRGCGLAVAGLAIVGCSDSIDATKPGGGSAPTEEVTALGPGTPFADGFTVPAGAELRMWPTPVEFGDMRVDGGWSAELRVTEPVRAFNELAAQADQQGFAMISNPDGDCLTTTDLTRCSADGYRERDGAAEHLRVWSQVSNNTEGSNASVTVEPVPDDVVLPTFGDGPWQAKRFEPSTVEAAGIEVDMSPPDVEPGERLTSNPYNPTALVEGSRLVYPVGGGFCRVTIEVTGDPDEVFAGYVSYIDAWAEEHGRPANVRPEQQLFGRRILKATSSIDGESYVAEMAVGLDDEPTRILLVENCE